MNKNLNNRRGKKVPLKFSIYTEDITELKREVEDLDIIEEFEDFEDFEGSEYKYESYVINDYITLKFEDGTTQIYIDGNQFMQCIRLVLHIPYVDVEKYDEIKSIDDAIDIYKKSLYQNEIVEGPGARRVYGFTHDISPEEEFRGHCSNIQAWAENDYNTCILHSNIAFPMLKKLTEVGDPRARRVFNEEIARRYEMGDEKFRFNLKEIGYLKYLTEEELLTLMEVAGEKLNHNKNRYMKSRENSLTSNAIYNFVSYYNASIHSYEAKKRREFLESCKQTLIELYQESFRNKNKPPLKKDIMNLIVKRKLLYRELGELKSEIQISGKLLEFLSTLEVLIKHLDPNIIENQLDSFKIEP